MLLLYRLEVPSEKMLKSSVVILFIFFFPYIKSLAVSETLQQLDYILPERVLSTYRFPLSLIPVPVVPVVPALSLLISYIDYWLDHRQYWALTFLSSRYSPSYFPPEALQVYLPFPCLHEQTIMRSDFVTSRRIFTLILQPSRLRTCGEQ